MTHTIYTLNDWLGYLFPKEIEELVRLVRLLPKNPRVLNIGAGAGVSTCVMLSAREDVHLTSIDFEADDSPLGGLYAERSALRDCELWDTVQTRFVQVHGSAHDPETLLKVDGNFDLIFVDDGHEYEECHGDITLWLPRVKLGGYLSVHDYRKDDLHYGLGKGRPHPVAFEGVDRAVDELLLGRYPYEVRVDSLITFRIQEIA